MTAPFEPLTFQSRNLAEEVAERLRERIESGEYAFGERVVEAQIARELEISRAPVREALAILRTEGLIEELPRKGAVVARVGPDDVRDIYELRAALETRAVRLMFTGDATARREQLAEAFDRFRTAAGAGRITDIARADLALHQTICRLGGNRRLLQTFDAQVSVLRALLVAEEREYFADPEQLVENHRVLVDALMSDDAERAEEACNAHLLDAEARVVSLMQRASGS